MGIKKSITAMTIAQLINPEVCIIATKILITSGKVVRFHVSDEKGEGNSKCAALQR